MKATGASLPGGWQDLYFAPAFETHRFAIVEMHRSSDKGGGEDQSFKRGGYSFPNTLGPKVHKKVTPAVTSVYSVLFQSHQS